jgi:hypothetical protein
MIARGGLLVGLFVLAVLPAAAQAPKVLVIGQDVKPGDHVTTGAGEQRPLLSPDGAALSVGQNSDLVLDKFQYDAAAKRGELALTLSSGTLRFVGGSIAKSDDVVVTAGSSVVRIHGASAAIGVRPEGTEIRMLVGERIAVAAEGKTETMSHPDTVITVPAHQPPSAPVARTASNARSTDWAKSFQDLDAINRTTSRAIEATQPARIPVPSR